jgi:hypothetical protein
MKIILKDMDPDDWILGVRAAKWLMGQFKKDGIVSYGDGKTSKDIYVRRNKASITARPCVWQPPQTIG